MTIENTLSPIERPYYLNLFASVSSDNQFTDNRLVEMLKKTGLSTSQLREIWIKYTNNTERISKLQFFTMMRAVALMQNGQTEDIDNYLLARNFPYLAKIQGIQAPTMPMVQSPNPSHMNVAFAPLREEDQRDYEMMINRVDKFNRRATPKSRDSFVLQRPSKFSCSPDSSRVSSSTFGNFVIATKTVLLLEMERVSSRGMNGFFAFT